MEILPEIPEFEVLSCLGYGARSTIYAVCELRTKQVYALKRVVRRSAEDDRFFHQAEQEYAISSHVSHPVLRKSHRLIRRRRFFTTTELHLLMDMFDGTSLDVERPSTLKKLLEISCQVAEGLAALHKMGYVHADIKPNNILVDAATRCKIIDFGQSCSIGTVKSRIQGTPDYIAPEQVALGPLTPATDIFNFGATLYWCVTDRHVPTVIPKKRSGPGGVDSRALIPPHELNQRIPIPLSKLILECVHNRPSDRPGSMDEIYARLQLVLSASTAIQLDKQSAREFSDQSGVEEDTVT
ncbi:MAG TPA: serine/threonine-protein kinase [Phycisphaerae bacterium]|nr:serine/threonine-protein kinase [Phycisphaerae bacterium]